MLVFSLFTHISASFLPYSGKKPQNYRTFARVVMFNASDRKCENPYRAVSVSVSPCYLCLLSILANVMNRNNRRYLSGIHLSPCSRALPQLTFPQVVKKFPAFYGTRRFIAAFTTARFLSLSRARSIQCIPPPIIFLEEPFNFYSHLKVGSSGRYK